MGLSEYERKKRNDNKFIAETLSHSSAKLDKSEKKDIYEATGIEEYWIVSPQYIRIPDR